VKPNGPQRVKGGDGPQKKRLREASSASKEQVNLKFHFEMNHRATKNGAKKVKGASMGRS